MMYNNMRDTKVCQAWSLLLRSSQSPGRIPDSYVSSYDALGQILELQSAQGTWGPRGQASSSRWRRVSTEVASSGVLSGASGSRSSICFTKSGRRTSLPVCSLTTTWALYQVPLIYNFKSFQQCRKVDVNFTFCKSGN